MNFFFFFFYLLVASHGLSLVAAQGGYSLVELHWLLTPVASFVMEHRLLALGLSSAVGGFSFFSACGLFSRPG